MRIFVADKTDNKMEKQFVPYELAVKLKELGFNEPCICYFNKSENNQLWQDIGGGYYRNSVVSIGNLLWGETYDNGNVSAPLWQQAFDWFREKYNLVGNTYANASGYLFEIHHSANKGGSHQHDSGFDGPNGSGCWDEFYEARQACLEKLIELITNK